MLMTQCNVNVSGNNLLFVESPHMYKCCCSGVFGKIGKSLDYFVGGVRILFCAVLVGAQHRL